MKFINTSESLILASTGDVGDILSAIMRHTSVGMKGFACAKHLNISTSTFSRKLNARDINFSCDEIEAMISLFNEAREANRKVADSPLVQRFYDTEEEYVDELIEQLRAARLRPLFTAETRADLINEICSYADITHDTVRITFCQDLESPTGHNIDRLKYLLANYPVLHEAIDALYSDEHFLEFKDQMTLSETRKTRAAQSL